MRVMWLLGLVCVACVGGGDLALDGPGHVTVDELGPIETVPRAVDAEGDPVEVDWAVEPGDVARVEDGRVVAVAPGTAEVTGTSPSGRVSWTLVVDPPLTLAFDDPPATVAVGEKVALGVEARAGDEPVEVDTLDWSVQPAERAGVDESGVVTGLSPGMVWVTASEGDSEAMLELRVTP